MHALKTFAVVLALCAGAASAAGRQLHADPYGTAEAATYYPPPPYYAPAPAAYQPTVHELYWSYPSDLKPPVDAYPEQTAYVGDSANFTWSGYHGVWRVPSGDCPTAWDASASGYKEIAAPKADGWAVVGPWTEPGTYWYACPVPGHCAAGMKVKYVVSEYSAGGWWYAVPWAYQKGSYRYPESLAKVGDSLKFSWEGNHGVWRIPSGDCLSAWDDKAEGVEVVSAPTDGGSASYKFEKPGTYWFTSPVPGDCKDGWMRYKWTVAA